MINAAIVGLGGWGQVLVNSVQGRVLFIVLNTMKPLAS
jgi:hypothetical protein